MKVLFSRSCLTLCNPVDDSPPGPSVWNSLGKSTGVGGHSLCQGIFLTQFKLRCPALQADFLSSEPPQLLQVDVRSIQFIKLYWAFKFKAIWIDGSIQSQLLSTDYDARVPMFSDSIFCPPLGRVPFMTSKTPLSANKCVTCIGSASRFHWNFLSVYHVQAVCQFFLIPLACS